MTSADRRLAMNSRPWKILVTGGAGYVGAVLVPKLLTAGHRVTVLDLYMYGEDLKKLDVKV